MARDFSDFDEDRRCEDVIGGYGARTLPRRKGVEAILPMACRKIAQHVVNISKISATFSMTQRLAAGPGRFDER